MQVEESKVRDLLGRMGYNAHEWSPLKLEKRLASFSALMANGFDVDDNQNDKDLRNELCEANTRGEKIEVVREVVREQVSVTTQTGEMEMSTSSERVESSGLSNESGGGTAVAEKKTRTKKSGEPKAKKEKAPVDCFGCRQTSGRATMNKAMSRTSQSVQEIAQKSGKTKARVYYHVNWLVQRNFAEKTDKGYALTGKTLENK